MLQSLRVLLMGDRVETRARAMPGRVGVGYPTLARQEP